MQKNTNHGEPNELIGHLMKDLNETTSDFNKLHEAVEHARDILATAFDQVTPKEDILIANDECSKNKQANSLLEDIANKAHSLVCLSHVAVTALDPEYEKRYYEILDDLNKKLEVWKQI